MIAERYFSGNTRDEDKGRAEAKAKERGGEGGGKSEDNDAEKKERAKVRMRRSEESEVILQWGQRQWTGESGNEVEMRATRKQRSN